DGTPAPALAHPDGLILSERHGVTRDHQRRGPRGAQDLDPDRQSGTHDRVRDGERYADREAGARGGEPEGAPGFRRHRSDVLDAALEDAIGIGIEDAASLHAGADPTMVHFGE